MCQRLVWLCLTSIEGLSFLVATQKPTLPINENLSRTVCEIIVHVGHMGLSHPPHCTMRMRLLRPDPVMPVRHNGTSLVLDGSDFVVLENGTIDTIRKSQGVLIAFVGSTKAGFFSFDLPLMGGPLSGDPAADHLKVAAIAHLTHPGSEFTQTGQPSKTDGKEYEVRVLVRILSGPGENTAATAKAWGDVLAAFYVKNSKFPTHPVVRVLNSNTSIADLPPVNHHIRNEDAARVAQMIYPEPIEDGTFWEHEPTVTSFFGDTENPQSLFHVLLDGDGDDESLPEHNVIN